MKKIVRWTAMALLAGAVAFGGYFYYENKIATPVTAATGTYTQVVQVKEGSLSSTLTVVGELASTQSEDLAFSQMSGTAKLAALNVKAGNAVTATEVLASIDPASYQQALDQAKSELLAAQKTLADDETPATTLEIAQADQKVADAQYQVEQAKQALADLQSPDLTTLRQAVQTAQDTLAQLALTEQLDAHASNLKTERDLSYAVDWYQRRIAELEAKGVKRTGPETDELNDIQAKLPAAQADLARVHAAIQLAKDARAAEQAKDELALANAQKALADAQPGNNQLALAKAQVDIQNAEVSLQAAQKAKADLLAGTDTTTLAAAKADVDKKTLAVAEAQAALDGTRLAADFDGTVLKVNANAGDQVNSGTTVLTVANLKSLQVVASIDETTIKRVQSGQKAQITFDAFPGQTFTGAVQSVPLQGSLQNGVMVYEVPVSLEGADNVALLVGMTANVKIQTSSVQNALLVPALALTKASDGTYQVKVQDAAGQITTVPVEIGLSDGTNTQITRGLNAGDQVVVEYATSSSTSTSSNGNRNNIGALGGMMGVR